MRFVNGQYSVFFLMIPLLWMFFAWALRRRERLLRAFAEGSLLPKIAPDYYPKRLWLKNSLLLAAVFCIVLALMRPQWGFVWEQVDVRGVDIFVAVDVSNSMLSKDVLPNRLERSKLAIEDLVNRLTGDRIGLIAFAGTAFVQCPLTIDYNGFLLAVSDLNTGTIPQPGTNIAAAIEEARKSFDSGSEGTNRVLIIITDGENHEADPLPVAAAAAKDHIRIFTIGVGTKGGELISIKGEDGQETFLKDKQGRVVKSRLNEDLLKKIAAKAKGSFVKAASTQFGLDLIYDKKISQMEKKEIKSSRQKHYTERFQLPLMLALCFFVAEIFIPGRKRQGME